MRMKDQGNAILLWLSASDTEQWATRSHASWPCSTLRGKRLFAAFDRNGIYELSIDGKEGDCDSHELNAICADHIKKVIKPDHLVYFVTVGQFEASK